MMSVGCLKSLKDSRKHKLTCFLIKDSICKTILKNSIFNHFRFLSIRSVVLTKLNFVEANHLKNLKDLSVVGIKIYDKIYSSRQLAIVNNINYIKNIKIFCMMLKKPILTIYLKLVKT